MTIATSDPSDIEAISPEMAERFRKVRGAPRMPGKLGIGSGLMWGAQTITNAVLDKQDEQRVMDATARARTADNQAMQTLYGAPEDEAKPQPRSPSIASATPSQEVEKPATSVAASSPAGEAAPGAQPSVATSAAPAATHPQQQSGSLASAPPKPPQPGQSPRQSIATTTPAKATPAAPSGEGRVMRAAMTPGISDTMRAGIQKQLHDLSQRRLEANDPVRREEMDLKRRSTEATINLTKAREEAVRAQSQARARPPEPEPDPADGLGADEDGNLIMPGDKRQPRAGPAATADDGADAGANLGQPQTTDDGGEGGDTPQPQASAGRFASPVPLRMPERPLPGRAGGRMLRAGDAPSSAAPREPYGPAGVTADEVPGIVTAKGRTDLPATKEAAGQRAMEGATQDEQNRLRRVLLERQKLNRVFGEPPKGMSWRADGTLRDLKTESKMEHAGDRAKPMIDDVAGAWKTLVDGNSTMAGRAAAMVPGLRAFAPEYRGAIENLKHTVATLTALVEGNRHANAQDVRFLKFFSIEPDDTRADVERKLVQVHRIYNAYVGNTKEASPAAARSTIQRRAKEMRDEELAAKRGGPPVDVRSLSNDELMRRGFDGR